MFRAPALLLVITVVTATGCQQTTAGSDPAGTPTAKAAPAVATWYTHEGAETLYRQAKYAQAEAMCKQAIADIEKAKGNKSPELAPPLIDLATIYMRLADFNQTKQVLDRAEALLDKTKPDQALLLGRLGINKGWRLYTLGDTDGAAKVFEEAQNLIEKNSKGDSIDLAELINNVGLMYEEIAEKNEDDQLMAKARRCLLQGWEMRRRLTGEDSPETAESLNNLGMHLFFNGDDLSQRETGLKTLRESLDRARKVYGDNHPETAMSHAALALALFMHDDRAEAKKEIMIAIPITRQFFGEMHPDYAFELTTLGHIQEEEHQFDDAEKSFLQALAINEHVYGKTHPNLIPTLEALKALYDAKGDAVNSEETQKRIEKLSGKDI